MKRSYRTGEEEGQHGDGDRDRDTESIIMADVLMLLSGGGVTGGAAEESAYLVAEEEERVFECRTCNRRFPTFQALGGHRASHKKSKLANDGHGGARGATSKTRVHECSICGIEFAIGQALGGHMRRHRAAGERRGTLLDLNLPPLETDDLKAGIGTETRDKIPIVDYRLY